MFRTTEEEARQLAHELRELKDVLRHISRKLAQIESRVKRAFPVAFPKASAGSPRKKPLKIGDPPTLSPMEALQLYDELVKSAKEGKREQVQRRLEELALPDLGLLSRELGVSLGKAKPSRSVLLHGVLGRISESMMLSASSLRQRSERQEEDGNVDRPASQKPDTPKSSPSRESS